MKNDTSYTPTEKQLRQLMIRYLAEVSPDAPLDEQQVELANSSYGMEEYWAAMKVLLSGRLSMGDRTREFEQKWSVWQGVSRSVMVNSGSSANLLVLSALASPGIENPLCPGDEVIVPAVAWSTSIFPIVQIGCIPVFVDVDPETFNISLPEIKRAISPRTRAILAIHVLGNPCEMQELVEIARDNRLYLIEDCCESHGAEIGGRKVGAWGDFGTFSFFFSHHITTGEGGMVSVQDRKRWGDLLSSLRAHGWIREREDQAQWIERYPEIDPRWLFVEAGYNLRPTELASAFGLVQLEKLDDFIRSRRAVREFWCNEIQQRHGDWIGVQQTRFGGEHSAFGFGLWVKEKAPFSRAELKAYLEEQRVQTRPVIGGNFTLQPVARRFEHRVVGSLPNATRIHHQGLMIGNDPGLSRGQQEYFLRILNRFVVQFSC